MKTSERSFGGAYGGTFLGFCLQGAGVVAADLHQGRDEVDEGLQAGALLAHLRRIQRGAFLGEGRVKPGGSRVLSGG